MKLIQVFYQIKLKIIKTRKIKKNIIPQKINNIQVSIEELDLDGDYLKRFDANKILNNNIKILNEEFYLNFKEWNIPEATHLWNFNLHYLEFLIGLGANFYKSNEMVYYNKFKEIVESWIEINNEQKGDGWQSYTISLRIINLLVCFNLFGEIFNKDTEFRNKVYSNIYIQYRFLLANQEKHLLGNHYFENLKTIVICSVIFNEKVIFEKYLKRFIKQIDEQILNDGIHFERSMMYHKIILEDIIRTFYVIKQYNNLYNNYFIEVIQRMCSALVSIEYGLGKTPHFNDSAYGISKSTDQLLKAVKTICGLDLKLSNEFQSTGYYKMYSGNLSLLFDIGEIGPKYMPGHGHCDALSFELSSKNKPIFVNSGTYNYQSPLRSFFRSTEAHNTFMIGNNQQSLVWGEHRVAKRISKIEYKKLENGFSGSFVNYLGQFQKRKIIFEQDNLIFIRDSVKTKKKYLVHCFLHLDPELTIYRLEKDTFLVFDKAEELICQINTSSIEDSIIHNSGILTNYSTEFGKLNKKNVLEVIWDSLKKENDIWIKFF